MEKRTISGFSKLSKRGKIKWIVENFFKDPESVMKELKSYWLDNEEQQLIIDGFSENTISNFHLPYGVAPNFLINGKMYAVPMVIEESSVVAAASSAAKFWLSRGGFHAKVIDIRKVGQVHFFWRGDPQKLHAAFPRLRSHLLELSGESTENMRKRGGGILDMHLLDMCEEESGYFQIRAEFDTCDSMGANFINTVLEQWADAMPGWFLDQPEFQLGEHDVEIVMSILSNYTPNCRVKVWVECPVEDLGPVGDDMGPQTFADRFCKALRIARIDPYRACTHNKGIYNGIDAVVLATGNDFRAIESAGHTYASRDGKYRGLSDCEIRNGNFRFWIEVPMAVGTVGGLTLSHPIAKRSLELLDNPGAEELMMIIVSTGLAQNFAAVRSLVTTGIQKGHMKLHLKNILMHLGADNMEREKAYKFFFLKKISFQAVRQYLLQCRQEVED